MELFISEHGRIIFSGIVSTVARVVLDVARVLTGGFGPAATTVGQVVVKIITAFQRLITFVSGIGSAISSACLSLMSLVMLCIEVLTDVEMSFIIPLRKEAVCSVAAVILLVMLRLFCSEACVIEAMAFFTSVKTLLIVLSCKAIKSVCLSFRSSTMLCTEVCF